MKIVTYTWYTSDKNDPDPERAVLPTIIFARKKDGIAKAWSIGIGWWAWGFGVIRTVVDDGIRSS